MKNLNELSTTPNVYESIIQNNEELKKYDKGDMVSKISTALSNLYNKNNINRIKNNLGRGYFWVLPLWYDDNGEIKKEYIQGLLDKLWCR